jgi:hypothetical protein
LQSSVLPTWQRQLSQTGRWSRPRKKTKNVSDGLPTSSGTTTPSSLKVRPGTATPTRPPPLGLLSPALARHQPSQPHEQQQWCPQRLLHPVRHRVVWCQRCLAQATCVLASHTRRVRVPCLGHLGPAACPCGLAIAIAMPASLLPASSAIASASLRKRQPSNSVSLVMWWLPTRQ